MKKIEATIKDLKCGAVLVSKSDGYEFTIQDKYDDGIWNAGQKCIFECEIDCYWIKNKEIKC